VHFNRYFYRDDALTYQAQLLVAHKWNLPVINWASLCGWSNIPCITSANVDGVDKTYSTPQSQLSVMTSASTSSVGDDVHPHNELARKRLGHIAAEAVNSLC
jgi:hypothetical protein